MSSFAPEPEYLQSTPSPAPRAHRSRRTLAVAVGAALVVGAVGVGLWGFGKLDGGGPQPDSAVPADALAYAAIDLDPSLGQKVEALQTLRKFPTLSEQIGSQEDLRRWLFSQAFDQCGTAEYDADVAPWVGHRVGMALVPVGKDNHIVVSVQVTDHDKADEGFAALADCIGDDTAVAHVGDYVVVAETQEVADDVAAEAARSPLADDAGYQRWVGAAGDGGIFTSYVAPDGPAAYFDMMGLGGSEEDAAPSKVLAETYADFEGLAAVVRLDDGSIDLHVASKGLPSVGPFGWMMPMPPVDGLGRGSTTVPELPADTAAAFGLAFAEGWLPAWVDGIDQTVMLGAGESMAEQIERDLGMSLSEVEAAFGSAASVALGSSVDPDALADGPSGLADAAVGLRVTGDPARVGPALEKLLAASGAAKDIHVVAGDGVVAASFDRDHAELLLQQGSLGETDRFRDAVPDAENANGVAYADLDGGPLRTVLTEVFGLKPADAEPLSSLGLSNREDADGASRLRLRLTTD